MVISKFLILVISVSGNLTPFWPKRPDVNRQVRDSVPRKGKLVGAAHGDEWRHKQKLRKKKTEIGGVLLESEIWVTIK